MDEAEFLGDRVAIMSHGKLKTCGSSLFLKSKFSEEFLIEVARRDKNTNLDGFEQILKSNMQ
jgi:ATP-binding cassette subfamily A (ABC1) protein 2